MIEPYFARTLLDNPARYWSDTGLMATTTEFDELLDVLRDLYPARGDSCPPRPTSSSSDEIPAQLIAQAKEMGLYGYALPTEYGGLGLSVEQQVRVTIELGYTSPAFQVAVRHEQRDRRAGPWSWARAPRSRRKQWLPRLASGELVASFALTEPDAGSDPSRLNDVGDAGGRRLGASTASSASSPTLLWPTSSWSSRAPTRRRRPGKRPSGCSSSPTSAPGVAGRGA